MGRTASDKPAPTNRLTAGHRRFVGGAGKSRRRRASAKRSIPFRGSVFVSWDDAMLASSGGGLPSLCCRVQSPGSRARCGVRSKRLVRFRTGTVDLTGSNAGLRSLADALGVLFSRCYVLEVFRSRSSSGTGSVSRGIGRAAAFFCLARRGAGRGRCRCDQMPWRSGVSAIRCPASSGACCTRSNIAASAYPC